MKKKPWIVAWMYNGITYTEKYRLVREAVKKMLELERLGMKPTLHNAWND